MNRLQFIIATTLSGLVGAAFLLIVVLAEMDQADQVRLNQRERAVHQGEVCVTQLRQVATRIAQVAQQSQDQALKDLLIRQGVTINAPNNSENAAAPSSTPATR